MSHSRALPTTAGGAWSARRRRNGAATNGASPLRPGRVAALQVPRLVALPAQVLRDRAIDRPEAHARLSAGIRRIGHARHGRPVLENRDRASDDLGAQNVTIDRNADAAQARIVERREIAQRPVPAHDGDIAAYPPEYFVAARVMRGGLESEQQLEFMSADGGVASRLEYGSLCVLVWRERRNRRAQMRDAVVIACEAQAREGRRKGLAGHRPRIVPVEPDALAADPAVAFADRVLGKVEGRRIDKRGYRSNIRLSGVTSLAACQERNDKGSTQPRDPSFHRPLQIILQP